MTSFCLLFEFQLSYLNNKKNKKSRLLIHTPQPSNDFKTLFKLFDISLLFETLHSSVVLKKND